ncbi:TPA: bifunctional proline dehydrogenase/L-glutamate gamma-semialdehyde dehydrogenase [Campylobacter fetus subsp. venerealis]|nr:bifunctional proline dehydrogenase/L-glutamate gamma-semialdehyde dehydrogenase [Campylobacter fetus subsp. venerealis]
MINKTIELASELQNKIVQNISRHEKVFHQKMKKLLLNPQNKVMLIELLDRSFRCKDKKSSFELIQYTLNKYGIADFFTSYERFLLLAFLNLGKFMPDISVPFFISHLRNETKDMVLDANENSLKKHIKLRNEDNITLNINLIGEEVLSEAESLYRIQKYEEAIKSKYITYISIKITTIFSQINIIDFEYSKKEIVKRLDRLYQLALEEEKISGISKFINLDMEEYRDLELTVEAFMDSISKFNIKAGLVLQAYIPDSYHYLQRLFEFSKERVLKGFAPIKIRLVKGANKQSEEAISSQKGWALPTFDRKIDTDSNYKKMLDFVLSKDNYKFINIGIASHNIFEIAHAYIKIKEAGATESFSFEMLEGMSIQCSYELSKLHDIILYAPVCSEEHFNNAVAYLVRRLDENSSTDNFMRYFFNLEVGSREWNTQKELFLKSIDNISNIDNSARRTQDRSVNSHTNGSYDEFENEPDTDFILAKNRKWAQDIKSKFENMQNLEIYPVAKDILKTDDMDSYKVFDKPLNRKIGTVHLANIDQINRALKIANESNYSDLSHDEIYKILSKAAEIFRQKRGDLIGIAALEVGKTFLELDPEVSEAIDFLEFYPHSLKKLKNEYQNIKFTPKGVGVVIAPWNFPIGITTGTIAAPLAAGNRVIYKPSSLSAITGYKICEYFWEAGVPKDALIFLPAQGALISEHLLTNDSIKFTILTGSEDTAKTILEANPCLMLSAETGGKNATIVSKMADKDQAIKNIIHSAFSNSGQKCSATSLLILEEEVYNDNNFKKSLVEAASSLQIGSPFELKNKLAALASKPSTKLIKAINELKSYEQWALKPQFINDNPHFMTPAIKYGTKEGDFTHMTELFAPILTVMCAKDLNHALHLANSTGYGLTAGFESLDEREWEVFHQNIEAGNIYINKPTTGAIVLRQPFGGIKKSAIGFGRKVGIYNYITQFTDITEDGCDINLKPCDISDKLEKLDIQGYESNILKSLKELSFIAKSYAYHNENEFKTKKDYVNITGEDNIFSYTKVKNTGYRISKDDSLRDIFAIIIAHEILEIPLYISFEENSNIQIVLKIADALGIALNLKQEDLVDFSKKIHEFDRIRYLSKASKNDIVYQKAAKNAKIIANAKPLSNGRFELLYYHNEKSLSISYHRYGNLGARALQHMKG